jgi:DNA-binding winged helix-turn-helix (wHTH) protein/tetratricopeptide (TPR) repeat protein
LLRFSGFELDYHRAELRGRDGQPIRLRPKSFATLHALASKPGKVFSKRELMAAVWPNVHVGQDSLFQCIRDIRAALGDERREMVRQISGRGYVLEVAVSASADDPAIRSAGEPGEVANPAQHMNGVSAGAPVAPSHVLAVAPLDIDKGDPVAATMVPNVIGQLTQGLSQVGSLRLLAPLSGADATSPSADLVLQGSLVRDAHDWTLQAHLVDARTTDLLWSQSASVATDVLAALQHTRLAAGVGHPLAVRLNELACDRRPSARSKIVINQATAPIIHTSREHFATAQAVLEQALAATPDDIEIEVALADHLLLGTRTAWYRDAEAGAAEERAQAILEQMLKTARSYLPVLTAHCRFLRVTNRFVESLVACAKALSLDPWDGTVLFQLAMSQLQMGRFEDAFETFRLADTYSTPAASRWSWLFGAGFTKVLMDRSEEALPWLQAALAVIPSAGRVHFITAAAYQRLGRREEAKAAVAKGFERRPGATVQFLRMPYKNASPRFVAAAEQTLRLLAEAGIPER